MIRTALLLLTLGLLFSVAPLPPSGIAPPEPLASTTEAGGETTKSGASSPTRTAPNGVALWSHPGRRLPRQLLKTMPDPNGATRSESTPESPAVGENGMVSTANPLATEAGLEVLADGGNAYDAAVTVPPRSGL